MVSLIWDSTLETGDAAVDLQHRAIYNLFARLQSAVDNEAEIMRTLDFLTEHVLVHFATEEALMARVDYPSQLADPHVVEHQRLTEAVRDQVLAFRDGRLTGIAPLVTFLAEWLHTHVNVCDRVLVNHVSALGETARVPAAWAVAENRANA